MTGLAEHVLELELADLESDPDRIFRWMRQHRPVAYVPIVGRWLVTRWDDCAAIGANEEDFGPTIERFETYFGRPNVMSAEGDVHKRLRAGIDPPMRPRPVQSWIEERARPVAAAYVDRVRARGEAEAVGEILEPISVRVVGDALGFGDIDDATLQRWFHALSSGMTNFGGDESMREESERTKREVDEHMRAAIARLAAEPDDSVLSNMVHTGLDPERLNGLDELIASIYILVIGGLQEPAHGAAASLLGLLQDPEQAARFAADPKAHSAGAVHEGLRWIAPFGMTDRRTLNEVEVAGVRIPAGEEIGLMLASANRDETRYDDPDRFDMGRRRQTHASFGYGSHFCSGHFVARRVEQVALEELFLRLPDLRLATGAEPVVDGFAVRGVKSLPVTWTT